jgi:hypothetical protein
MRRIWRRETHVNTIYISIISINLRIYLYIRIYKYYLMGRHGEKWFDYCNKRSIIQ